jgi:hypothetical protein
VEIVSTAMSGLAAPGTVVVTIATCGRGGGRFSAYGAGFGNPQLEHNSPSATDFTQYAGLITAQLFPWAVYFRMENQKIQ